MLRFRNLVMVVISVCMLSVSNSVLAEGKKLTGDEIKKLFIGKTCDGHNTIKDKNYMLFTKSDSTVVHSKFDEIEWEVNDDEHCIHLKKLRCGTIHDMGDGVYHKMNNGEHINTLKNFRDGNDL